MEPRLRALWVLEIATCTAIHSPLSQRSQTQSKKIDKIRTEPRSPEREPSPRNRVLENTIPLIHWSELIIRLDTAHFFLDFTHIRLNEVRPIDSSN